MIPHTYIYITNISSIFLFPQFATATDSYFHPLTTHTYTFATQSTQPTMYSFSSRTSAAAPSMPGDQSGSGTGINLGADSNFSNVNASFHTNLSSVHRSASGLIKMESGSFVHPIPSFDPTATIFQNTRPREFLVLGQETNPSASSPKGNDDAPSQMSMSQFSVSVSVSVPSP
ncbi:hypothetical protein BCR39DRAFT_532065 [Naematelia encephala]|uniref:Uncharacterized protein n=1 Tax=Naematelia encephala TaxID=71784 RepID=A0A1Y2B486_9TREE|nr:hypothetical protein BCR39DRAFT_532065 [Naematelia encephala]